MPTQCPQYPHNAHNAHTMPTIPTQCPQYPHNAHTIPTQCPQCHTIPTQCPHNTHTMPTQYPHNAHNAYAMPTMATQCPHNAHNTYTIPTQCPHNAHVPCSRLRRSRFQSQSLVTTRQTAMRQVSYLHILIYFALISSVRSFDWMNRYNILYRRKKHFIMVYGVSHFCFTIVSAMLTDRIVLIEQSLSCFIKHRCWVLFLFCLWVRPAFFNF